MSFVQLHLHTTNSLLDGAGSMKNYIKQAVDFGMPAVAVTEHGNMSSSYDWYKLCKKNGIKPIIGSEFYIRAAGTVEEQEIDDDSEDPENDEDEIDEEKAKTNKKEKRKAELSFERKNYHQIVLVKNEQGWKNACKLNYYSFIKPTEKQHNGKCGGFYYKPRIEREALFDLHEGLITTSTCMASEFNRYILDGKIDEAYKLVEKYRQVFGDDFYIELQMNELDSLELSQKTCNTNLIKIANDMDIKMIMTGDVHYANKGDHKLQHALIAIKQHTTIDDPKSQFLHAQNLYFHNREDYYRLNEDFNYGYSKEFIDKCLDNTLEIADKVNFEFSKKKNYPKYFPDEKDSKKKLYELVKKSFSDYVKKRGLNQEAQKKYAERIKYEYSIIEKNGYVDYFLVVWDIVNFCKESKIFYGARGSAGSSIISFLLGISSIDPIEKNLFFERFINPDALSEPDIDMDFDSERREEIIEYLKSKWGEECVIKIGNYMTFHVKGALRDLVRVYGRSKIDVDFICSVIPEDKSDEDVDEWFEQFSTPKDSREKRIFEWYGNNRDIIEDFKKISGENRGIGQHAGGILITPEPIYCYIPINRARDGIVTGYPEASGSVGAEGKISRESHKNISELGLLKIDALGLQALTTMKKVIELVKVTQGKDITDEVINIELDNNRLYEAFANGDTSLVFQFEEEHMVEYFKKTKPKTFDDIVAINSLNRPATKESGAYERFSKICAGLEEQQKIHPTVDHILENSKGVIAFQEQLSRIIHACTGISYGRCEKIRKAITDFKKYPDELEFFNQNFVRLCHENGMTEEIAEFLKSYLLSNAGYLFNQSHSEEYSKRSVQTMYLKLFYPNEFYSVALSTAITKTKEKVAKIYRYINDAVAHDITVEPPNIFHSKHEFVPVEDKKIVCGLSVVKGLGDKAYEELLTVERNWKDLADFLAYPWKKINKKVVESLIKAGAMKELEPNMRLALELAKYHYSKRAHLNKKDKKGELKYSYDMLREEYVKLKNSRMTDMSDKQKDKAWAEVTGFNYPFRNKFINYIPRLASSGIVGLSSWSDETPVVYGEVLQKETAYTKSNKPYLKIKISDGFSESIFKVWENQLTALKGLEDKFSEGNLVYVDLKKDDFGFSFNYSQWGKKGKVGVL